MAADGAGVQATGGAACADDGVHSKGGVSAALHRFLVSEVRPVRFGPAQDASAALVCTLSSLAIVLLAYYTWTAATGRSGLWRLFAASNQAVAALLLFAWATSYSAISLVIWHQFERGEHYPADDHYLTCGEDAVCDAAPIIVMMPDRSVALGVLPNCVA